MTSAIEKHYFRPNLYKSILQGLKEMGVDLQNVTRKDIASVDEFHVRGAEVSREIANTLDVKNSRVLDVGCGIGGPCRMLADEFGCHATGIDLSQEFIKTATRLSELVGLGKHTRFIQGDAVNLPFDDTSFDVVWTQHVQMNVRDKQKFYSEIDKVLIADGTLIYYDIFRKGFQDVQYPVPWADDPKISFLENTSTMDSILTNLGLKKEQTADQTEKGILFFEQLLKIIADSGVPKLGLNLLMGTSTKTKIINLLNGLKEGKIILQSGVYKK